MEAQSVTAEDEPLLEMRGISKTFGNVRALDEVTLTVRAGELHALMGENGAGKSTLMKILSGAYVADAGGEIRLDGRRIGFSSPDHARRAGISVIYQELSLAPNLSVAENVFLGRERGRFGVVSRRRMERETEPALRRLGVSFGAGVRTGRLSLGERQLVEIARALTADSRIIVMDEPTTSLTTRETERLFEAVEGLKRDGIAILYISHRMEEVYRLADRCSVLRDGSYIGTLERDELSASRLVSMMVGRDLSSFYRKEHAAVSGARKVVLEVEGLGDGALVHDVSFEVAAGEVLGIAGLVGSGRTETARLVYGADPITHGTITLEGRVLDIDSPRRALDAGIAYLTEDRKALGLFLDMSVAENVNIGVIAEDARAGGLLDGAKAAARARGAVERLNIRTAGTGTSAGALSGGNQQKVLLARLLETAPKVIILDEPTRGVDVGAKSEIYRLIDALAKSGVAIVVISSDLPEIIGIADRVLVMRDGTLAGEVINGDDERDRQEEIVALATGSTEERNRHA